MDAHLRYCLYTLEHNMVTNEVCHLLHGLCITCVGQKSDMVQHIRIAYFIQHIENRVRMQDEMNEIQEELNLKPKATK